MKSFLCLLEISEKQALVALRWNSLDWITSTKAMKAPSSPRWRTIITEELKKKAEDRLDIPGYESIILEAIRDILTAERQNLSTGGFPIQQATKKIICALAEQLEEADQGV